MSKQTFQQLSSGLLLFFLCVNYINAQDREPDPIFENPNMQAENRLPMRAAYFPFEDKDLAKKGAKKESDRFLDLNGTWKFFWTEHYKTFRRILKP